MTARAQFAIGLCMVLIATTPSLAQSPRSDQATAINPRDIAPRLYREPMTQSDMALEWYAYWRSLAAFVHFEDHGRGVGVGLGDRINFRKQVDVADYTVWMRGWCGG